MKKNYFVVILLLVMTVANGQTILFEGFEDPTFPPSNWAVFDNGFGPDYQWNRITFPVNNGIGAAEARWENDSIVTEDWLVTPLLNIIAGAQLEFYMRQSFSADFNSKMHLYVSTASQTTISDFVKVKTWNESDFGIVYEKQTIDLSSYAGQQVYVAFVLEQDDGDTWTIDDVHFFKVPDNDLTVSSVEPSGVSCEFGQETIKVVVENIGIVAQSGFDVAYSVNGGTPVVETISASIAPGTSHTYSFTTQADFSTTGSYSLEAYTLLGNDSVTSNDTMVVTVENTPVITAPFFESFDENEVGRDTLFENFWRGISLNDYMWRVDSASSPGFSTGPSGDVTLAGAGKYVFVTANSGIAGDVANLESPCVDITNLTTPELSFFYHKFGTGMGDLYIDIYVNGQWQMGVDSIPGSTHQAETDPWLKKKIDLSSFSSLASFIKVRFRGVRNSFNGEMAIDGVRIDNMLANDLSAVMMTSPVTGCGLDANQQVTMSVTNLGTSDQTNFAVGYSIDGTTPVIETVSATLSAGATMNYTFTSPVNLSVPQTYMIQVFSSLTADQDLLNDTLSAVAVQHVPIIAAPFLESLDSNIDGASGQLYGGWATSPAAISTSGSYGWRAETTTTTSSLTGPDAVFNGTYLYTEASGSNSGDTAVFISPCISLTGLTVPQLYFMYHKYGADMGDLFIDVYHNNQWINAVDSIIGQTHQSGSDVWLKKEVDLMAYNGSDIRIRFTAIRGANYEGDMAIDNISVKEKPANDVELVSILSPVSNCGLSTEQVVIKVKNIGLSSQNSIPVVYNNGGVLVHDTLNVVLNTGDSSTFTFTTPIDLSIADSIYSFTVYTDLSSDSENDNDTLSWSVEHVVEIMAPLVESFDSNADGATGDLFNNWKANPEAISTSGTFGWRAEDANTSSSSTGPNNGVAGVGSYMYTESSGGSLGDVAYLTSPCINISSMSNPELAFWYHMYGVDMGTLNVDVFANGQWNNSVEMLQGEQHITDSTDWSLIRVNLASYLTHGKIRIRFRAERGDGYQSDMAIDVVEIREKPANDLTMVGIISPTSSCNLGAAERLTVVVENTGAASQNSFDVAYRINGAIFNTETITRTINPGDTIHHQFISTVNLSSFNTYVFDAKVILTNDQDTTNDFVEGYTVANYMLRNAPYVENFDANVNGEYENFAFGWSSMPADQTAYHWEASTSGTLTSLTGPAAPETGSGSYIFVESTEGVAGDTAVFLGPCIDLGVLVNPQVRYRTHRYGSGIGDMFVDARVDGVWYNIGMLTGEQHTSSTDSLWDDHRINIQQFAGKVIQLRFSAVKVTGEGDMAIDNIEIDNSTSVEDHEVSAVEMTLFPNPTQGDVTIALNSVSNLEGNLQIIKLDGSVVYQERIPSQASFRKSFSLEGQAMGMYMVVLVTNDNVYTKRLIVE